MWRRRGPRLNVCEDLTQPVCSVAIAFEHRYVLMGPLRCVHSRIRNPASS